MSKLKIKGGIKLKGEVIVQGSKNEALQIISATLLTKEECIIHNVPNIIDVNNLLNIFKLAGAEIKREKESTDISKQGFDSKNSVIIKCENINGDFFLSEEWKSEAGKLRGSITLMGPALARFGAVAIPTFGGDKIGKRPIDTHINGFVALGYIYDGEKLYRSEIDSSYIKHKQEIDAIYKENSDNWQVSYKNIENQKVKCILLEEASVTGTANMLLAASNTKEKLIINNVACEPYIEQLATMLNSMGMNIQGAGTNRIIINNTKEKNFEQGSLKGVEHRVLSDFLEVASFLALAAITNSDIFIKGCSVDNLGMTLLPFKKLGINFDVVGDDIHVYNNDEYRVSTYSNGEPLTIYSEPWPKVSPDILSLLLVAAIQSHGTVLIHEKMYESRLFFTDKLIGMGAQIILCDPHRAIVVGLNRNKKLQARKMDGPDIRAGMALVIAALSAEGESVIDNAEQIDRGYENLVERLRALGADIEKV